jgi:NAD(P)H-nitrite reductase large subunit
MEHLSAIGDEERATLERLGLAAGCRMACCARVNGPVTVALKAERGAGPPTAAPAQPADPAIRQVVIIGNGIAGVTAADHVRRTHPDCEIHVVGREGHHLYNRMAITRLIYGRSAMQGLYLMPESWYDERRITTWLNTRAVRLDPAARQVALGTGETLAYDRLILASGSSSAVPPIPGADRAGSFVLREADDAMRIRAYAQERGGRRAVVAGGGLLGLEAAYALHKLNLGVTVLERSAWPLRRQLDERAGELLREQLHGLGIEVLLRAEIESVEGDGWVREVRLADGRTLPADLCLICAGITPNVALAREAGLSVNRGVVVDERMRTSAPGIFAAGDVAEFGGQVQGLWPTAVEQAQVAARNALGLDGAYVGVTPTTILKVAGIDLTSTGRIEAADGETTIALLEDAPRRYRKLVIGDGRIVGTILLGHAALAPTVQEAIRRGLDVRPHLAALRAGDWSALGNERVADAGAPAP